MNDPKPRRTLRMNGVTIKLLDELRHICSDDNGLASDDVVAQEPGVPKSTVAAWRTGGAHMDAETVLRACDSGLTILSDFRVVLSDCHAAREGPSTAIRGGGRRGHRSAA
jgi:hypothetical protein